MSYGPWFVKYRGGEYGGISIVGIGNILVLAALSRGVDLLEGEMKDGEYKVADLGDE